MSKGKAPSGTAPVKLKRGRPATGQTPGSVRTLKSKQALLDAGGRRTTVNLSPEANEAVKVLKDRHQLKYDSEVIEQALLKDLASKT